MFVVTQMIKRVRYSVRDETLLPYSKDATIDPTLWVPTRTPMHVQTIFKIF